MRRQMILGVVVALGVFGGRADAQDRIHVRGTLDVNGINVQGTLAELSARTAALEARLIGTTRPTPGIPATIACPGVHAACAVLPSGTYSRTWADGVVPPVKSAFVPAHHNIRAINLQGEVMYLCATQPRIYTKPDGTETIEEDHYLQYAACPAVPID